jgi:hypothetical protein
MFPEMNPLRDLPLLTLTHWPSQAVLTTKDQYILVVFRGGPAYLFDGLLEIIQKVKSFNQGLEVDNSQERLMLRGIFYDNVKGWNFNLFFDYLHENSQPARSEEEIRGFLNQQYGSQNDFVNISIRFKGCFFSSDHFFYIHDDYYDKKLRESIFWKD